MQGIYQIVCLENGKTYIGSSVRIDVRWVTHKWQLNRGLHSNTHLQNAWNKYGSAAFKWSIIEEVAIRDDLEAREQAHVELFRPEALFNIAPVGRGPIIYWDEDRRERLSIQQSAKYRQRREANPEKAKLSKLKAYWAYFTDPNNDEARKRYLDILAREARERWD